MASPPQQKLDGEEKRSKSATVTVTVDVAGADMTDHCAELAYAPDTIVVNLSDMLSFENPASTNPGSAFYMHPTTRSSLERAKSELRTHMAAYEADLEKGNILLGGLGLSHLELVKGNSCSRLVESSRPSKDTLFEYKRPAESTVWPSMRTLRANDKKARREERTHTWFCLGGLKKQHRVAVKIVIVVLVIALAVGVGVGISVATGGSVVEPDGENELIPPPH